MPLGGSAGAGQRFQGRHRRLQAVADGRPRRRLGRPRPALRRPRLRRTLPAKPETGIGPHLRPDVRPPLGHLGRAGRRARGCSPSRSPTAGWRATACRVTGAWSATRRPSRSAAARRSPSRPTAGPSISRCARRGGSSRLSTNLDIFAAPSRRHAPAGQPDRRQRRHRQPADRVARRADARLFRDGARRATRPTARC